MLAIEDLHWADRSTRDLLRFLASEPARRADRDPGHLPRRRPAPRAPAAAAARRARARGLGRAPAPAPRSRAQEVAEQIAGILGEPAAPAFVNEVFERAEGNAFCVEQLVATAREGGGSQLPTLLQDILHARFERLSPPAQRLLGVVAAGGPRVREALIAVAATGRRRSRRRAARRRRSPDPRRRGRRATCSGTRCCARPRTPAAARRAAPRARRLRRGARAAAGATGDRCTPSWRGTGTRPTRTSRRWPPRWRQPQTPSAATATPRRARTTRARSRCGRASTDPRRRPARAAWRCSGAPPRPTNLAGESTRAATLIRSALEEIDADLVPDVAGELHERLGRYLWAAGASEAATVAYEQAVRLVPAQPAVARSRASARRLGPGADAALALRRVARALRGRDRDRPLGRRPARGGPRAEHARRRPRLPRRPGHAPSSTSRRRARSPRRSAISTTWRAPISTWPRSSPRRSTGSRRRSSSRATASRCARRSGSTATTASRCARSPPARCSSSAAGTRPRRSSPRRQSAARSSARRSTSTWRARRSPRAAGRSTPPSATSPPSAS